jgi:DNA adenine methylase
LSRHPSQRDRFPRRYPKIRPAAAYIGGKRRLGEQLARRIQAVSRDVATLFRILQRHYPQFMETLKFQITSRREFDRLAASKPDTLTDLERAGRFLDPDFSSNR